MRIVRFFCLISALTVILSVSAFAAAPVIVSQPQNYYLPSDASFPTTVHFSIMASGDQLSYQWQYKRDGSSWTDSETTGANTPMYSPTIGSRPSIGTYQYRCVVSSPDGETVSQTVSAAVTTQFLQPSDLVDWTTQIIGSIVDWIGSACSCIIDTPLLLAGVSFFALGASIAIISHLLSRS